MKFRTIVFAALLVAGFVYLTSSDTSPVRRYLRSRGAGEPLFTGPQTVQSAGSSSDEDNNIEIYKAANMATVNITSTVYQRGWFFEIYPSRGSGSGFLINEDGQIVTNSHVISGRAPQIQVTLADKTQYDAEVVVRDQVNDLALIKVNARKKLPYLRLGDSDGIQVGQKVLAIGNPFGLNGTLTTGIVSSLGRTLKDENDNELEEMIQTDAAINPGNSGGPLLDSQGNVIAVNTAIYGPGGNIGIGFAMPINTAKRMLEDYRSGRQFGPPVLGVSGAPIFGTLAQDLELPAEGGFLIFEVTPGLPAQQAGLRGARRRAVVRNYEILVGGDLIMAIDGRPIQEANDLTRFLRRHRPGDTIELTIFRDGRQTKVKVQLGGGSSRRL